MERWKTFEDNARNFLDKNIKLKDINFTSIGKSNSWDSDIEVLHKKNKLFTIEAKLSPAQSGQFVVWFKNNKFLYSEKNHEDKGISADKIVEYLNLHIEQFKNCGTAGEEIKLDKKIFFKWIKEHYAKKEVKFIIVSDNEDNFEDNFIRLLKLDNFEDNFEISCKIRYKKSGSAHMPKKYYSHVVSLIEKKISLPFKLTSAGELEIQDIGDKPIYLDECETFYLSKQNGKYLVKKLSKRTSYNLTVIFSLEYTGKKETNGFQSLIDEIKGLIY